MKTSSSDLFYLIKSMSKTEKGYFKKLANMTKGEKVYLKLFDAIDAQNNYDEIKIKDKFKAEQFVKQFSVAKNNLYTQILKSLNQSSMSANTMFQLKASANYAEILFNKGLLSQALKLIGKLKRQAGEIEEFDVYLQFLDLEKSILLKRFDENEDSLDDIYNVELDILEKRRNFILYQKLFNRSYYLITKYGHVRDKKEEKKYLEILNSKIMKNENLALSVMAKIHYNEVFFYYYVSKLQFNDALKCTTRCLELIEKNRAFLTAHLEKYLSLYQNHILQHFYLGNFQEVEVHSHKLKSIIYDKRFNIPERVKISSLGKLLCITFVSFISSANFEESEKAFVESKELIENYESQLDNSIRIILFNQSAYYNFIIENYPEALKWINKLLNDAELKFFVEIICNARWFELLIHYELDNLEHIDNMLKTNKRYLNKKEKMYGVEKLMIKFFSEIVSSKDVNKKALFNDLLHELEKVTGGKTENDYGVDYYNITGWTRSKIHNKSFRSYLENVI